MAYMETNRVWDAVEVVEDIENGQDKCFAFQAIVNSLISSNNHDLAKEVMLVNFAAAARALRDREGDNSFRVGQLMIIAEKLVEIGANKDAEEILAEVADNVSLPARTNYEADRLQKMAILLLRISTRQKAIELMTRGWFWEEDLAKMSAREREARQMKLINSRKGDPYYDKFIKVLDSSQPPSAGSKTKDWVLAALPWSSWCTVNPKPWMKNFADNWLKIAADSKASNAEKAQKAKELLGTALDDLKIKRDLVLAAVPIIEKSFSPDFADVECFARCMLKLAIFAAEYNSDARAKRIATVDDYLGPLQFLDNPRSVEIGLRLALIVFAKTVGDLSEVRQMTIALAVDGLFDSEQEYEDVVERIAQAQTNFYAFSRSLDTLRQVYASSPERFMEGLGIFDAFHERLVEKGKVSLEVFNELFKYYIPYLVRTKAGYSREVLEKQTISNFDPDDKSRAVWHSGDFHTKVKISAGSPDWFEPEMNKLAEKIENLAKNDVDPLRYFSFYTRILDWIEKGLERSPEAILRVEEKIYEALIAGKTDQECGKVMYFWVHIENLREAVKRDPDEWTSEKVRSEIEYSVKEHGLDIDPSKIELS